MPLGAGKAPGHRIRRCMRWSDQNLADCVITRQLERLADAMASALVSGHGLAFPFESYGESIVR